MSNEDTGLNPTQEFIDEMKKAQALGEEESKP
jgi:hypothetical protein